MPQAMLDICNQIKIPKQLINYFGDRGFVIEAIPSTEFYRILHHRWGSIANTETHVNQWTAAGVKRYLHEAYYFENKSDSPEDEYRRILQEKWFTDTDLKIVMAIYFHRVMTTSQLNELGFYSSKSAIRQIRSRCKQLADNFVLHSFQPSVDMIVGAAENHYMLGEVGAHIVADYLNKHVKEIGWTPRHNEIMMHTVYHIIEINNVFQAFRQEANRELAVIQNKNHSKDDFAAAHQSIFQVEKTIAEYLVMENIHSSEGNVRFNPDGLMYLKYKGVTAPLFLEVDRNTMDLMDFSAKVPRYEAYARSKLWETQIMTGTMPPVIVCTTDEKRMIELARVVYQKQKIKNIPWLFTTLEKVKNEPLGQIWIQSQDADKSQFPYVSLLDAFG